MVWCQSLCSEGIMQKIKTAEFQSSTKIEALLQEPC